MSPFERLAHLTVLLLTCAVSVSAAEPFRPPVIHWGASTAELEAALEPLCTKGLNTRPIEPPFLPEVEDRQLQIDCDGLAFLGSPRWVEFVIGDDRLQMVWLMVEPGDQEAMVEALTEAYGQPSARTDEYIAFTQARAAWRFEPPEILFYSPPLDDWVAPWFE